MVILKLVFLLVEPFWTFFHFPWTLVHSFRKKVQTCLLFIISAWLFWTFFHFPWTLVHSFLKKVQTCFLFSFRLACLDLFSLFLDFGPHFLEKGPNLFPFLISAWLFGPFFTFLGLKSTLSRKRSKLVSFSHFDLAVWTFFHFSWT